MSLTGREAYLETNKTLLAQLFTAYIIRDKLVERKEIIEYADIYSTMIIMISLLPDQ